MTEYVYKIKFVAFGVVCSTQYFEPSEVKFDEIITQFDSTQYVEILNAMKKPSTGTDEDAVSVSVSEIPTE